MEQRDVWNAIAPEWHQWREKPLPEVIKFIDNAESYLDIGCGSRRHFIKGRKIIGVDFSAEMVKLAGLYCKEKGIDAAFIVADACKMPIKDKSFERVVAAAVLHVIPERRHKLFLEELKRIMKKGGKCIITVWNRGQEKFAGVGKENYVQWGKNLMRYYYLFEKDELENLLKKSGFTIDRIYLDKNEWNIIAEISKP